MKPSAFESAEGIWPLRFWAMSSQQRRVLAREAARPFARRWAALAAQRACRALTCPAFGVSGSAHLFTFAVSFLKSFLVGVITVLVCTLCPLLGKQWLKPAKKKILLLCSGRCCGTDAGRRQQVTASSRSGPTMAPFTCHLSPLPHDAHLFRPVFGSSPVHAATMPNKSHWDWLSTPLPQGLFELGHAITLLYRQCWRINLSHLGCGKQTLILMEINT